MTEATNPKTKTVKVKAKVKRPTEGRWQAGTKYADDPLGGLSAYQKILLAELREAVTLNIKEATSIFVDAKPVREGKQKLRYEDMTPEQQKIERNTCRKTFEKLAQRRLVDIFEEPNVGERMNRNRELIKAAVGKRKAYKLAPGASKLVAGL